MARLRDCKKVSPVSVERQREYQVLPESVRSQVEQITEGKKLLAEGE